MSILRHGNWICLAAVGLLGFTLRGDSQENANADHCLESRTRAKALRKMAFLNRHNDPDGKLLPKHTEILDESEALIKNYDLVGRTWLKVLDDKDAPNSCRCMAAFMLSEMRYLPAIPVLIKQINLEDHSVTAGSSSFERFIVVEFLGKFENAAVPAIVDAWLGEKNPQIRNSYEFAISFGNTTKEAITYMRGLRARGDKRVTNETLELFLERFDKKYH